jgi:hypothetical protein
MKANSLSSATDTLVDVLGYPLAGALVAGLWGFLAEGHGIELAFYVDAATYGFSALMIYRISASRTCTEQTETAAFGGLGRAVLGGLRFVRSSAVLFTNTAIVTVAVLLFWGSYTLTYGYATEVTDTGAFGYSVLEAALGLGATVGGACGGPVGRALPEGTDDPARPRRHGRYGHLPGVLREYLACCRGSGARRRGQHALRHTKHNSRPAGDPRRVPRKGFGAAHHTLLRRWAGIERTGGPGRRAVWGADHVGDHRHVAYAAWSP